jgi:NTE family protein
MPRLRPGRDVNGSHGDRIVTWLPLSNNVAGLLLARTAARVLHEETGASVLLVDFQRAPARASLMDWSRLESSINGEFAFGRCAEHGEDGVTVLPVETGDGLDEPAAAVALLRHALRHFHHVQIHAGADVALPLLMEFLHLSTRAFLLLEPAGQDLYRHDLLMREVRRHRNLDHCHFRMVLCRPRGGEAGAQDFLRSLTPGSFELVSDCPPHSAGEYPVRWTEPHFVRGARRLAREVARRRVGIALSSGGARGLAHIGVIQVLEENGIEVDYIAGCSMGSYVGAVWAAGHDGMAMERFARAVEHRWGLLELIDPYLLPRRGFLKGDKTRRRLERTIGDVHFAELPRPFRVVATHLHSLDRVVFASGSVPEAVQASSAIPGACVPVELGGELYIDGGVADPLPVDILEDLGVERIIAVNTIPPAPFLRAYLEQEKERTARLGRRGNPVKMFLHRYLNYFASGNILDTILRSFNGAQMRVAEYSSLCADVVLRPLSFDGRWHDFRRPGKYIAVGRREAEEHLEDIKAVVNRRDPLHEPETAHHPLVQAS